MQAISNRDAWYNVTRKEISSLESVDETLIRKIFSAHSKIPLELLYLETGTSTDCIQSSM